MRSPPPPPPKEVLDRILSIQQQKPRKEREEPASRRAVACVIDLRPHTAAKCEEAAWSANVIVLEKEVTEVRDSRIVKRLTGRAFPDFLVVFFILWFLLFLHIHVLVVDHVVLFALIGLTVVSNVPKYLKFHFSLRCTAAFS